MNKDIINMAIKRCIERKQIWLDDLNWADEQNDKVGVKKSSDKIEQEEITIFALNQLLGELKI